jgi:hypothetical protein
MTSTFCVANILEKFQDVTELPAPLTRISSPRLRADSQFFKEKRKQKKRVALASERVKAGASQLIPHRSQQQKCR